MQYIRGTLRKVRTYIFAFFKWLAIASVLGAVCGFAGSAFHLAIGQSTALRAAHPWIIWLLPFGGMGITMLYTAAKQHGNGTSTVIDAILHDGQVPRLLAPVMFVSTVVTHLLGGSAGREGAALQIGGGLGSLCGSSLRLRPSDQRITILCGMAAVFTALFGTPTGAALFVLEISNVGAMCYSALVPCLISSGAAYTVTHFLHIVPTRFAVKVPSISLSVMGRVAVLAIGCALLSVIICAVFHRTECLMAKWLKNRMLRAFAGGAAIIALTLLLGTTDYNGAGEPVFRRAIEQGQCAPEAFALKLLFTAITLGCGFRGGEVVPTFFIGAAFGCTAGPLLGLPAGFAAAVGLAATFCGATNCPLATLLLSAELFRGAGLEAFAIACAVSYLFSGYSSLYPNQRFLYSKVSAELWHAEKPPEH